MATDDIAVTTAVRFLRGRSVPFVSRRYDYQERGGTARASEELGIDEHCVIKTLVFQTETGKPLLVLMHGDREVSVRQLARLLGTKSLAACDEATAQRVTGYLVGGISPFGTRTALPVYAEASIFDLPRILVNGGKRGFLVEITPSEIERTLPVTRVSVGILKEARGGPSR